MAWGNGTYLLYYDKTFEEYGQIIFVIGTDDRGTTIKLKLEKDDLERWIFISATYDGYYIRLYKNGNFGVSGAAYGLLNSGSDAIYFGKQNLNRDGSEFFYGKIGEVRIWNVAKTQTEIILNMNNELSGNENGLIGYWKMDEGNGDIVYDFTPNENHGTIHGATWSIFDR